MLARGDFAGAQASSERLVEQARTLFGPSHGNTASAYSTFGGALFKQGRYAEAETAFRQALTIYEERSGGESVQTASGLNNLALVLEKTGDYRGAELLLQRSLAILRKERGANHPDTATTMSNLGRVLDSQGKFGASASVAATTTDNTEALSAQADDLVAKGQYREAESLQQRVVAIHEKTLGAEHPLTATSLSNLGNVLYLQEIGRAHV